MIKLKTFIFAALISANFVFAQTREKVDQTIEWSSVSSTIKIHKNVGIYVEGNFRFAENLQPMQHQFRAAAEFKLSKKIAFIPAGYVYTWNYKYGKQPVSFINNEHRIYQQLTFKNSWKRLQFQQRFRMEERFNQARNNEVTSNAYTDERYRLRFRTLVNIPLNSEEIEAGTWYANVWDEVFLSWGKAVAYDDKPDQNRVSAGLGYQVSKPFSVQVGIIYQYMIKKNGLQQENNYGGVIQLAYNFDLTKAN